MRVGIVGSRRRDKQEDREIVQGIILNLWGEYGGDLVIVSGGCGRGADRFAKETCESLEFPIVEHLPDFTGVKGYGDRVRRYYARNRKIAEDSDMIIALVARDRRGGTENTIKHAEELGKLVVLNEPWKSKNPSSR